MSYVDRLQPALVLTSPSGREFSAKWVGDERSFAKRLGIFKTPGVDGVTVQDFGVEGTSYPLTFWFDGSDNDLIAALFLETCRERGPWSIIHPVHGPKTLHLVSVAEDAQPVRSGNVTQFDTEWLEALPTAGAQSVAQLAATTVAQGAVVTAVAADQVERVVSLDTADKAAKVRTAARDTVSAFDATLKSITDQVAGVSAQVDSIKRGIDSTLIAPLIDVVSLAGQIQALIALPALVAGDFSAKLNTLGNFMDRILGGSPESASPAGINTAAIQELSLTSALGVATTGAVTSDIASRAAVIDALDGLLGFFDTMTDGLDATQDLYSGELLGRSYFSQSQSYNDSALMVASALAALIASAFDLAAEKRITLTRVEHPVMLAMREYGGPGDGDVNIALFYSSNALTGQETLLLPAGREVVVYL